MAQFTRAANPARPDPASPRRVPPGPAARDAGAARAPGNKVPEAIIQARGVTKVYESGRLRVEALTDVDLDIRRGEMVAIMGPSGCGKTTLLNCLSGLDDVTRGRVLLEGQDVAKMGDRERTRLRSRRMGFVFQSFNLLPVLSAVENVELPLLVSGVEPKEAQKRAMTALSQVGLAPFADHRPRELSGGQQQRVTVARSLVNNPAIVWADEPTGNLDTKNSQDILDLLHRLNRELGQTYVIVSHERDIARSCHRVVHMESGRIRRIEQGEGRSLPLAQYRRA